MKEEKQISAALIRSMRLTEPVAENPDPKTLDVEDVPVLDPKCPTFP